MPKRHVQVTILSNRNWLRQKFVGLLKGVLYGL